MTSTIQVLIADDSETIRNALALLLVEEGGITVVGQARDGREAVELAVRLRPDVITMDVRMPNLDGLAATEAIMRQAPSRIIVISSVTLGSEVDLSFQVIAAGALELIAKPIVTTDGDLRRWGKGVARAVKLMSEIPVVRRHVGHPAPAAAPTLQRAEAIGIVASTGGPSMLVELLAALPGNLPVPLLVAQHITAGFTAGLARWFGSVTALKVEIARHGSPLRRGTVYLAPDARDLEVQGDRLVNAPTNEGGHCPSGDRLFFSLARQCKGRAAGILLTGMGEDGARGLLAIRNAGGSTFVQDEASCVVFGMPQAALRLKAVDTATPKDQLPAVILGLCGLTTVGRPG